MLIGTAVAYGSAATFSAPSKLTSNSVFDGMQTMSIDSNDKIHVVYARGKTKYWAMDQIYYRSKPKGGSWSKNILVTSQGNEAGGKPVVIGHGANAYVLTSILVNDKHQIALFKITSNGAVHKVMVTNNNNENAQPSMTIKSGIIYIVWFKENADMKRVVSLRKFNTTTGVMTAEKVLTNATYKSGLEIKSYNDKLHMIWMLINEDETSSLIYRKTDLNGSLIEQSKVVTGWQGIQTALDVYSGQPYVAYISQSSNSDINIFVARLVNGAWTKTAITNDSSGGIYNELPQIRVKQGIVNIVYQSAVYNTDPSQSQTDIVYATGKLTGLATAKITKTSLASENMPVLDIDSSLKAHIIYQNSDGDDELFYRFQNN